MERGKTEKTRHGSEYCDGFSAYSDRECLSGFTFEFFSKDFLLYPVMKSYFDLSENDVYKAIQDGFEMLQKQLAMKSISYDALKGARNLIH